jgi:hypothetical protein
MGKGMVGKLPFKKDCGYYSASNTPLTLLKGIGVNLRGIGIDLV